MTLVLITTAPVGGEEAIGWPSHLGPVLHGDDLAALHRAAPADCTWVLRAEPHEHPTPALLAALDGLLADEAVRRVAFLRRWLAPEALGGAPGAWLAELPWGADAVLRLVRRDEDPAVWSDRWAMDDPAVARSIAPEPLVCTLARDVPREERRDEGVVREAFDPGALGPDRRPRAVAFDPEGHARRPPAPAATLVPEASGVPEDPHAEVDVRCVERDIEVPAGHGRFVLVAVTNRSGRRWGGPGEAGPVLRLSQHVRDGAGALLTEGPPQELTAPLAPSQTRVMPLWVGAPAGAGALRVEVGVVEDHARWLPGGAVGRFAARAVVAPEPVDRRPAADAPAPRRGLLRRRAARPAIPRVLHRVWLGGAELPGTYAAYGETWREHHPDWELRLWTEDDAPVPAHVDRARNLAERADLVRYEVLRRHGGVYVDTDIECLRAIDGLIAGLELFAAYEVPGRVCNAVIGCTPGHPALARAARLSTRTVGTGFYPEATATTFLTRVLDLHPEAELLGPERFYPYLWDERRLPPGELPDAYAIHHWAKSWSPAGA